MRKIFASRVEMLDRVVSKWKDIIPNVEMLEADARAIISESKKGS